MSNRYFIEDSAGVVKNLQLICLPISTITFIYGRTDKLLQVTENYIIAVKMSVVLSSHDCSALMFGITLDLSFLNDLNKFVAFAS